MWHGSRLLTLLVRALAAASVSAQQTTSNHLRGLVTDESGSVLPGVTIELRSGRPMGPSRTGPAVCSTTSRRANVGGVCMINFASILRRDVKMMRRDARGRGDAPVTERGGGGHRSHVRQSGDMEDPEGTSLAWRNPQPGPPYRTSLMSARSCGLASAETVPA